MGCRGWRQKGILLHSLWGGKWVQQGGSLSTKHPKTTRPNNPMSVLRHRKNQNSQWPMHPCFQGSSTDNGQTRIAAGQNLGFLCPVKPNKKYRDRVGRKYEGSFYSQASRDGNTVGSCLKDCVPPTPPMKSLGAHIKQGLTVRSQWWGTKGIGSQFLPPACFQRQS